MRWTRTENLIAGCGPAAEAAAGALRESGREALIPAARILRLITDAEGILGAVGWDEAAGDFAGFAAEHILLADPDADLVFTDRCGIATAYGAGASMADLERVLPDETGAFRTLGGLITDAEGRTDVPGLWAAGASAAGIPHTGEASVASALRCARSMAAAGHRGADREDPERAAETLLGLGDADIAAALDALEAEIDKAAPAPWDLLALQTVCEAQHHLNELPPAPPAQVLRRLLIENRLIAVRLHLTCSLERRHTAEGFPGGLPVRGGEEAYRVRTAMRDGMFYVEKEALSFR